MKLFTIIVIINLLQLVFPHHTCQHSKLNYTVDINQQVEDESNNRFLASKNYSNIRIYADFSIVSTEVNSTLLYYLQNDLLPTAINYYTQTLKVVPSTKNLTTKYSTICSLPTPSIYAGAGISADLALLIDAGSDDTSYIAMAKACILSYSDYRPVFGNIHYNLNYLKIGDQMQLEQNLLVTIHEMAHVFGISQGLFQYYINATTGAFLTGHYSYQTINGLNTTVVDVEPLTTKLRNHFNCPSIQGAYLENEGESLSLSSHFERRIFYDEIMTASYMNTFKLSDFTLAYLEGSGWYQVNYTMAEPVFWGKNKGCDFYNGPCMDSTTQKSNFAEFCSALTEVGCSADRRSGASCGSTSIKTGTPSSSIFNYWGNNTVVNDAYADNCPYFAASSVKDCEDPTQVKGALIKDEAYGSGSKCFTGNIFSSSSAYSRKTNYCLKSQCQKQSDSSYAMILTIGSVNVTCTAAGSVSVPGYTGQIDCPDPNAFCNTYGSDFCPRGCMGNGKCVSNQCQCEDGWGGSDCATRVLVANCTRCKDDPFSTSCFGNSCGCDSEDVLCLCASGQTQYCPADEELAIGNSGLDGGSSSSNSGFLESKSGDSTKILKSLTPLIMIIMTSLWI